MPNSWYILATALGALELKTHDHLRVQEHF